MEWNFYFVITTVPNDWANSLLHLITPSLSSQKSNCCFVDWYVWWKHQPASYHCQSNISEQHSHVPYTSFKNFCLESLNTGNPTWCSMCKEPEAYSTKIHPQTNLSGTSIRINVRPSNCDWIDWHWSNRTKYSHFETTIMCLRFSH